MFMETGTGVSINLTWSSSNQMSTAEYVSASKEQLQTLMPGIIFLDEGNVTVNGGACYKLVVQYELQQTFLKAIQITALSDRKYFSLTLTASEAEYAQYEDTFNQVIESFVVEDIETTYLQTDFGEFKDRLDELQEEYDRLLAQSAGYPAGSTYDQLSAWDYVRVGILDSDYAMYDSYYDENIAKETYEIGNDYLRNMLVDMIGAMQLIKENADPQWYPAIEKFVEAANWDIMGFDNYRMYMDTYLEEYRSDYFICVNNSADAGEAAWIALNNPGSTGTSS